jgi:hypothetical protein
MNPIEGMTDVTPTESANRGESPADYVWSFNGIRPDGAKFSIDPVRFIMFAQECHPEYIDIEKGEILVMELVLTESDANLAGDPSLAGTVAVTIRPDLGMTTSWAESARAAANRYPANPAIRDRFYALANMLESEGFDNK